MKVLLQNESRVTLLRSIIMLWGSGIIYYLEKRNVADFMHKNFIA